MILLQSFNVITIVDLRYVLTNSKQAEKLKDIQIETYMQCSVNSFGVLITLTASLLFKNSAKMQLGKGRTSYSNISTVTMLNYCGYFCREDPRCILELVKIDDAVYLCEM